MFFFWITLYKLLRILVADISRIQWEIKLSIHTLFRIWADYDKTNPTKPLHGLVEPLHFPVYKLQDDGQELFNSAELK